MPAGVSGSLNAGTVLQVEKCWPLLRCVIISVHIFGVLNSLYARTTSPSGGFKSFAIVTVCWPAGICFPASSQLPLNTDRGRNTLMLMAFPVSAVSACNWNHGVVETGSTSELAEQPFAESAMGDSMETWVTATHLDEATGDLPPSDSEADLITSSFMDKILTIDRVWVRDNVPQTWSDCAGLSPELCLW